MRFLPRHARARTDKTAGAHRAQESDGGSNYTTTDLATLEYRLQEVGARHMLATSSARRRQLHFRQIFAIFRREGRHRRMLLATSGSATSSAKTAS